MVGKRDAEMQWELEDRVGGAGGVSACELGRGRFPFCPTKLVVG